MTPPIQWMGSCFYGNGPSTQQLAIVGSGDGKDWWWLSDDPNNPQPQYTPPDGDLLRDPTYYWANISGTWTCFIAYTHLSTTMVGAPGSAAFLLGSNFGIAKSTTPWDKSSWTHVADIDCSVAIAATPSIPNYAYYPTTAWLTATTSAGVSGAVTSIPVNALPFAIPASAVLTLPSGQQVTTAAAIQPKGATSITLAHSFTISPAMVSGAAMTASSGTYVFGDYVSYSGSTYVCTVGVTSTGFFPPSTDTSHWARRTACWGPSWFFDTASGKLYVAMQMNIQDIYLYQCLDTTNFNSFDTGTLVVQHSTGSFPSTNYATCIVKSGSTYHMFANTQTSTDPLAVSGAGVWHATSSSLLSGWTYQNLDYGGVFEGTYVVNDGTQWIAFGDNPTHVAYMTTSSLNAPITWSAPTPLTLHGGLAQSDSGPGEFSFIREGAFAPIGIPASPSSVPGAFAVMQGASIWPPKMGVNASG